MKRRRKKNYGYQKVKDFFVAGGTLRPDTPSYVERPTDDELFNLAMENDLGVFHLT